MLIINQTNNSKNINYQSWRSKNIVKAYEKTSDPLKKELIRRNKDWYYDDLIEARCYILFAAIIVAALAMFFKNSPSDMKYKETNVLKKQENKLDKEYTAGTLLFEEYINGLNKIKSEYQKLETQTSQKLDDVVQTRIERSDSKSAYTINPETGKYDYELSSDPSRETVTISISNN